ncbi:L,D-transpeptidase family protein [Bradyrhizobium diazoefficiens]|uniref:L,D-transpeptidase family protein n=1 Tax=Bradyrhizobium diazoefficiens TaxID=1355477 RepID=UPI0035113745
MESCLLDRAMFAQGLRAMQRAITTAVFAIFMLPAGIVHAQFLFEPQHTFWPGQYAHKHHHRQTNSETAPEPLPKGPLQIIISIADQRVSLFDNGALIARSSVSTGMEGHPTPLGVFSVISKQRWHRSNIYSAAPMPYMQRITWSGIALHAGVVPGHPASHGCIRLKNDFAVRLWHLTKRGTRVIIAHGDVQPVEITNPHLFQAKSRVRFVGIPDCHRRNQEHRYSRSNAGITGVKRGDSGSRQSPGAGLGSRCKRAKKNRPNLHLRQS